MKDHSFFLQGSEDKGVLLVHGLTGTPIEMRFVGKQLNNAGFTVYAPTLAGHCADEQSLINTTYEDWLESLRNALCLLKSKAKTVSAAGICVGGGLALLLAHQEPEKIDKVAIYAPALDYDGWNQPFWSKYARIFKDLLIHIPSVRNAQFKEVFPFGVRDDRVRQLIIDNPTGLEGVLPYFPARSLYQNYRMNDVLKKALPEIKVPTLLIHAKDDDVSNPRNSRIIQKKHGGHCNLVLLEDSYHMIHVDQERHRVAELTADFFVRPQILNKHDI